MLRTPIPTTSQHTALILAHVCQRVALVAALSQVRNDEGMNNGAYTLGTTMYTRLQPDTEHGTDAHRCRVATVELGCAPEQLLDRTETH